MNRTILAPDGFPHRVGFEEGMAVHDLEKRTLSDRSGQSWRVVKLVVRRWWWHLRLTCAALFMSRPMPQGFSPGTIVAPEPEGHHRRGWIVATIAGTAGIILLLLLLWHGNQPGSNTGAPQGEPAELAVLGNAGDDSFVPPQQEPVLGRDEPTEEFKSPEVTTDDTWSVPSKPKAAETAEPLLAENDKPRQRFKVFNPDEVNEPRESEAADPDDAFRDDQAESPKLILGGVTPRIIVQPEEEELILRGSPTLAESPAVTTEESEPARNKEPSLDIAETKPAISLEEKEPMRAVVEDEPISVRGESRTRIVLSEETPATEKARTFDDEPIIAAEPQTLEGDSAPWRRAATPGRSTTKIVPAADPFDEPLKPMQPVSGTVSAVQGQEPPAEPAKRTGAPRVEVVRSLPDVVTSSSGAVSYEIIVRNRGTAALAQLTVEERIPAGMRVAGTSPAGTVEGRVIRWEFSDLEPESEETIRVSLRSDRILAEPSLTSPEMRVRRELPVPAGMTSLRLKIEAPARLQRGQAGVVRFFVMNDGSVAARQVQISTDLPKHLSHPRGPALFQDLGTIAPGETRIIDLRVTAVAAGSGEQRATVTASGNLKRQSAAEIPVQDRTTSMAGCVRIFN